VAGTYAYVADYNSGLQVVDINDPANPSIVGACDTPGFALSVYVTGTYAYVADYNSGLQVVDISDPANPSIVGACDTPGFARGVSVAGTYAFVADEDAGLQLIDISEPANPSIVGAYDTRDKAWDVYATGTYAYVADGLSGLQVIEKKSLPIDVQYMDSGTLIATIPAGYLPGTYNLHVTNPDGGHAVLHNAFTAFEEEVAVKMELPAGWSMISLPLRPEVPTVANVFPQAVVMYKYQKGAGYVRVTGGQNLEIGMGYWILLNYPRSYLIKGTEITEYTLPVADGWYMIGGCSSPTQKMVTSGKIDVVYGYTQGKGYTRVSESQLLERGKGYWILFSNTSEGAEFTASTSVGP
jgi:hypothetical protein